MAIRINTHTHTTYSDGRDTTEALLSYALQNNTDVLAVTDHFQAPPELARTIAKLPEEHPKDDLNWLMKPGDLQEALSKLNSSGDLEVLSGMEVDYFPDHQAWTQQQLSELNLDMVLGSYYALRRELGADLVRTGVAPRGIQIWRPDDVA